MHASQKDANLQIEPQAFSKQSHQFWTLQLSGWLGYVAIVFIAIIRPQLEIPNFNFVGQLINLAIEAFSGFVLSYLQWLFIQRIVHLPLKKTLFLSFLSAAVLGLIFNIIKLASFKIVVFNQVWYEQWNMLEFGGWFLFSLTTMFIWTALFFIMLYNTKLQKEHEMLLRAQNSAKETQLQMLRYQLNPHFMFNTMNAISTLIYKKDNDKAGEMLDQLCSFFRYSLDQETNPISTLHKELELLDLYLSIEKVRFGDRLSVAIDVPAETYQAQVPSLFLQPIVENAIKYAIETQKENGKIAISANLYQDRLIIKVEDNGSGSKESASSGFGIGLTNTKERLETMFNDNCSLDIAKNTEGAKVSINIPFLKVAEHD